MSEIITLFQTLYIQVITLMILIDILLGITAAVVKKDFLFAKLADFMKGPVIAYILGFAVLGMVAPVLPMIGTIALGPLVLKFAFVLIVLTLLASIFRNLKKLGLPLPGILEK
ncbi:MAG: phage holin family protein [Minisyncoccales bacterium]